MGNEEHLAVLRQGVEVWNEWRNRNQTLIPDLSSTNHRKTQLIKANLSKANLGEAKLNEAKLNEADLTDANLNKAELSKANLSEANLSKANLNEADLWQADLTDANLNEANLSEANLSEAKLNEANLGEAKLNEANLIDAVLRVANLSRANLSRANLSRADLREADLRRADLRRADLRRADLRRAKLSGANLSGANLSGANLSGANLSGANLSQSHIIEADIRKADLKRANLIRVSLRGTRALETNFQRVSLTGACIEDWHINSETKLDNVICDYIYLKENQKERRPHDPNKNFAPGEFTKLFQKALETVDLIFKDGIDWQAFLTSFQNLQVKCGSDELSIHAIEKKSGGAFVIRVEVPTDANKAEVEKYLKREYEYQLKAIEEKYRLQLNAKDNEIAIYHQQSADLLELAKLAASRPITVEAKAVAENQSSSETYNTDLREANVANFANKLQDNARQQANQYNYASNTDLAEAAKEIQQLLEQLSQTYPTETLSQKAVVAEEAIKQIENDPTFKERVVSAIKAMGVEALMEAIDHPVANVLRAGIEAFKEPTDD